MIDYMRTKAEILYTPKAIIPQLVFTLSAKPENHASIQLQLASVRALRVTMEECAPRMEHWKRTIMGNVAQRWVILKDNGSEDGGEFK